MSGPRRCTEINKQPQNPSPGRAEGIGDPGTAPGPGVGDAPARDTWCPHLCSWWHVLGGHLGSWEAWGRPAITSALISSLGWFFLCADAVFHQRFYLGAAQLLDGPVSARWGRGCHDLGLDHGPQDLFPSPQRLLPCSFPSDWPGLLSFTGSTGVTPGTITTAGGEDLFYCMLFWWEKVIEVDKAAGRLSLV